ncbi:MAG: hypothetical protein DRP87_10395 [Spirochaetes bacterium]|nr:MAG: hypothetical protein DRP87_10395 [Spirochaetota bacterium]
MSGKRLFFAGVLSVFLSFGVSSQTIDLREIDFKNARLSIAGPDRLYIRSVGRTGKTISLLIAMRDEKEGFWHIESLFPESADLFPEDLILDFVKIEPIASNRLKISGIIYDGQSFAGEFLLTDTDKFALADSLYPAPMPEDFEEKITLLKGTLIKAEREGYEQRIAALRKEKEEQEEITVSLLKELEETEKELFFLEKEKKQLEESLSSLRKRKEQLNRELSSQKESITRLSWRLRILSGEKTRLIDRIETSSLKVNSLTEEKRKLQEELIFLKEERRRFEEKIKNLQKENRKLISDNRKLELRVKELKQLKIEKPVRDKSEAGIGAVISKEDFPVVIQKGFHRAVPQMGNWFIRDDRAEQLDPSQYFAKLVIPVIQNSKPTLFSFKGRSTGSGWVGFGAHIFATEREWKKGYGFGDSILVWITRDREYYGCPDTRLQFYRSSDSVHMEMVLDAIIEEPIHRYMDLDILYNPVAQYISVFVNGAEKVKYKTWFSIDSGVQIALRTLRGGASFKDMEVRSTE